jgi:hypothetical protein
MLLQLPADTGTASRDQVIGSGTVLLALLSADALAWTKFRRQSDRPIPRFPTERVGWTVIGLVAMVMAATVLSLASMPRVPIIVALTENLGTVGYSRAREAALKLGESVQWLGPLCAISLAIAAPIAVLMLWIRRHAVAATALFLWCICYGLSTTARLPSIMLVIVVGVGWSMVSRKASRWCLAIAVVGIVVASTIVGLLVTEPSPMFSPDVIKASRDTAFHVEVGDRLFPASIADRHRVWSIMPLEARQMPRALTAFMEASVYRALFTPADVSIRWYQYFSMSERRLGLASVALRPSNQSVPSRVVGEWAFRDRFPKLYLDSANAYASLDADAYARGGLWAACLGGVILAGVRASLIALQAKSADARICYGVGIGLLFLLPAQASLQAILVIHGLGVLVTLSALQAIGYCRSKGERCIN